MWKHIGAGKIGLGLVSPKLDAEGINYEIYDRNKAKVNLISKDGYKINGDPRQLNIKHLDQIELNDQDILSTSVKPENVLGVLEQASLTTNKEITVYYLPFENKDFESIKINSVNFIVVETMVDRIVIKMEGNNIISEKWCGNLFTDAIPQKDYNFQIPNIKKMKRDKLKSVNGSHFIIGWFCKFSGYDCISDLLRKDIESFNKILTLCCSNQGYISQEELRGRLLETMVNDNIDRLTANSELKMSSNERFYLNFDSSDFMVRIEKFIISNSA